MRYPIIDASGAVINVVLADEAWLPPAGLNIGATGGEVGDIWDGSGYRQPQQAPPELPSEADYAAAIQHQIDALAREHGYNDGVALSSYIVSTNTQWQAEAAAFVAWRDAMWTAAYGILADVQAGRRPAPALAELAGQLPQITWP